MKNFTKPQLLKSLVFPVLTLLESSWVFLSRLWLFWANDTVSLFDIIRAILFFFAVLFGGVLTILMTVKFNVHTERYFFKRLITFGVCFAAIWLMNNSFYHRGILGGIYIVAVVGGKVVYELLKVQDKETTGAERAVMFLSDYIIVYGLDVFLGKLSVLDGMKFLEIW